MRKFSAIDHATFTPTE